jgi:hypothetical protein
MSVSGRTTSAEHTANDSTFLFLASGIRIATTPVSNVISQNSASGEKKYCGENRHAKKTL